MKLPTQEEMVKNVAEKALDEVLYDGRSIREWIHIIASEDAISKKAVLDKIKEVCFSKEQEWIDFRVSYGSNGQRAFLINFIESLPPITPQSERKIGKWIKVDPHIVICPFCKHASSPKNFCADCGADMRGK